MHLMTCLTFLKTRFQFSLFASHVCSTFTTDVSWTHCRGTTVNTSWANTHRHSAILPSYHQSYTCTRLNDRANARLDISTLDSLVERYFEAGLEPFTERSCDSAKRRILKFWRAIHVINPLPVNENLLCRYVAYLAWEVLSPKFIKLYLSSIRHLQIKFNSMDPKIYSMPAMEQEIKGAKKEAAKQATVQTPRLPITPQMLLNVRRVCEGDSTKQDFIMMWAATCLYYFGFLRAGGNHRSFGKVLRQWRTPELWGYTV